MWALLALVAKQNLHRGAMGYGILNGCIGLGAVIGAMPDRAAEFVRAAQELGKVRRRNGVIRWARFSDPFDPAHYMESYVLESWLARERQLERFTVADRTLRSRVFSLRVGSAPPSVTRLILAQAA